MSRQECTNSILELHTRNRNLIELSKGVQMDMASVNHSERAASLMRTAQAHLSQSEDALALLAKELLS